MMLNYLPERIYQKIKDDPRWDEVDKLINDQFKSCGTLVDVVLFDENSKKYKLYDYQKYLDTLNALVDEKCPEYKVQLRITLDNSLDKDHFLALLDEAEFKEYDRETMLYILSYLISTSYDDKTFNIYQKQYVQLYESIGLEERKTLSNYINLKYINAKVEDYSINLAPRNEDYLVQTIKLLNHLYEEFKQVIDKDLLSYIYIEIFDHTMTNAFLYVANDILLYEKLPEIVIPEDIKNNKYKGLSINELGIIDKEFELFMAVRDFESAAKKYDEAIEWINESLRHPQELFKVLRIYDKVMAPNYCALLRRYVKIMDKYLNEDDDLKININSFDKEFILRDDYSTFDMSNKATKESFERLTERMDQWLLNNKITMTVFGNYYHNIYKG